MDTYMVALCKQMSSPPVQAQACQKALHKKSKVKSQYLGSQGNGKFRQTTGVLKFIFGSVVYI